MNVRSVAGRGWKERYMSMKLFEPQPIPYERVIPIDADSALLIKRWPGEVMCAQIRRVRIDELLIKELEA